MTENRPLRIFLCHASQDKPIVRELRRRLASESWIDPWLDEEKLSLGQHWTTAIEDALDTADSVVIFLSKNSVQKEGFVQRELNYAWELSLEKPRDAIFLIPFRLDDCEVPRYLRSKHWGDYFGEKKEITYQNLLQSLKRRYEQKLRLEADERAREEELAHRQIESEVEQEPTESELTVMQRAWQEALNKANAEKSFKFKRRLSVPTTSQFANLPPATKEQLTPSGHVLHKFGDIEFVKVSAGKFLIGSGDKDKKAYVEEKPQHTVDISYDYYIARFPITNEQYASYVKVKGIKHPVSSWEKKRDHPVVNMSWNDAIGYCRWLNDLQKNELPSDLILRLPTEAEWEKAARGTNGLIYPWGDSFDKNKCNTSEGGKGDTTPVGSFSPLGDSPYGVADMAGNIWEWTHSLFKNYPYKPDDSWKDENISYGQVVRGGSFVFSYRLARCAYRYRYSPSSLHLNYGFRVVVAPSIR